MNDIKMDQVCNLLKVKGYKFKKRKNYCIKFKNYSDAFNAAMDVLNSFISAASEQDNKVLHFYDYITPPVILDEDFSYKKEKTIPSYEGIMMSFSFYLSHLTSIEFIYKIKKRNKKEIIIGDVDKIYNEFIKENKEYLSLVNITKKKKYIIFTVNK